MPSVNCPPLYTGLSVTMCAPFVPTLPPSTTLPCAESSFRIDPRNLTENLCPQVPHKSPLLSFAELKAAITKALTPSLGDTRGELSAKTKKIQNLREIYPSINRFCVQVGGQFLEIRFHPGSLQKDEVFTSVTNIEVKPAEEPPSSYLAIPINLNGIGTTIKLRLPLSWDVDLGEIIAVRTLSEMPQDIAEAYVHPVQVQSFCSGLIAENITEVERQALEALTPISDLFNQIIFSSGRDEFWLPADMTREERAAFEKAFPDTQVDHQGGNHPLRYAGTIVVRDNDPQLLDIPIHYPLCASTLTVGKQTYRYYPIAISHHPRYAEKIGEIVSAIRNASHTPNLPIHLAWHLEIMADTLERGDIFQMMHEQFRYHAELGSRIQSGTFDETRDSSIVFWLVWRAWKGVQFPNSFLGTAIRNPAASIESRLHIGDGVYEEAFKASEAHALELMQAAVEGDVSTSEAERHFGTLLVVPTQLGGHISKHPGSGGVNMYSVDPGNEENFVNVIIPDGVHGRAAAIQVGLRSLFGSEATTLDIENIALLLQLLVTRHERGHKNGADFLHTLSPYKSALEEARADAIALIAAEDFLKVGLLTPEMQKAYIQIALFQYLGLFLDTDTIKPKGDWNAELFSYGTKGQPHNVGRTFLMRYLLEYGSEDRSGIAFIEEEGHTRLSVVNTDLFMEATRAFLQDDTRYLNAADHEGGVEGWSALAGNFKANSRRINPKHEAFIRRIKSMIRFPATLVRS